jgi:steroid 5-alpha reductase family enzyme
VKKRDLQRSMYELQDASRAQRLALAITGGVCVGIAWWLLFGGGLRLAGHWLGRDWTPGDPVRRACLGVAFSVYYIRILFTEFVFLKRGVSWSEVFTIAPWLLVIFLLLAVTGGTNSKSLGFSDGLGIVLFLAGSWANSWGEYQRDAWKRRPENHGRLYTQGLFRYSRHPNYLGDLSLFSGMCVISGAWIAVVIPVLMLAGFLFVNIPVLDSHLHDHYGSAFDRYAEHTSKLIPFVY